MNGLIRKSGAAILLGVTGFASAFADELTGSQNFLCTGWSAISCTTENECNVTEAWRLNMPDFVTVDLQEGLVLTTLASDQPREAAFEVRSRENGMIVLQGVQGDRAWSWVINQTSGEGTMSISTDNSSITLFTVCTPTEPL